MTLVDTDKESQTACGTFSGLAPCAAIEWFRAAWADKQTARRVAHLLKKKRSRANDVLREAAKKG